MVTENSAQGLASPCNSNLISSAYPSSSVGTPRPASVAAEMLASSALRIRWPTIDRRKVVTSNAAVTCRDAAVVLQEAASQLLEVASALENGGRRGGHWQTGQNEFMRP